MQKALLILDAALFEPLRFLDALNALGNDRQAQFVSNFDQVRGDDSLPGVLMNVANQVHVDLDEVGADLREQAKRVESGAQVIRANRKPSGTEKAEVRAR